MVYITTYDYEWHNIYTHSKNHATVRKECRNFKRESCKELKQLTKHRKVEVMKILS